jgi:hypothetical protein
MTTSFSKTPLHGISYNVIIFTRAFAYNSLFSQVFQIFAFTCFLILIRPPQNDILLAAYLLNHPTESVLIISSASIRYRRKMAVKYHSTAAIYGP